jgi:hypothetical protein
VSRRRVDPGPERVMKVKVSYCDVLVVRVIVIQLVKYGRRLEFTQLTK